MLTVVRCAAENRLWMGAVTTILVAASLSVGQLAHGQSFSDVPTSHWAYGFVEALASNGITRGCDSENYCPRDAVTRAQMAVFLERGMRGSNFSPPAATGNVFLDVEATDFAAGFIEQFYRDGVTSGCGGNNYCPADSVTRAQMAVFLLRAKYGSWYLPPAATGVFQDVPIGSFAAAWIERLAAEGITSGCGAGVFCPDDAVTRAQMAVFIVRNFDLVPAYGPPIALSGISAFGTLGDGRTIKPNIIESADLNGDGFEDFIATKWAGPLDQIGPAETPLFALNDGDGSFIEATNDTVANPLPSFFLVRDILVEDFNGDGQADVFFSNHGLEYDAGNGEFPCERNALLLSGEDGLLHDVSATHLPDLKDFSHGSTAADIDGDGDIDIWVNNLGCDNGPPSYLLENDGDGVFTIVANGPVFMDEPIPSVLLGANDRLPGDYINSYWSTFVDADNDGDQDLYVSITDPVTVQTFLLNNGLGAFEFAPPDFLPDPILPSVNDSAAVDINGDDLADLILFQIPESSPGGYVLQLLIAQPDGGFQDATEERLPQQVNQQQGAGIPQFRVGDINGDEHPDIMVKLFSNDFSSSVSDFFLNDGVGNFRRLDETLFDAVSPNFLPLDVTNNGYDDFVVPADPVADGAQFLIIHAQR